MEDFKDQQNPLDIDAIVNGAGEAPTEAEKHEMELLELLKSMTVTTKDDIPADVNTMSIGGVPTFAYEGIHFIKAKAKQGKTSTLAMLEGVYVGECKWAQLERLSDKPLKVRHIDTEQKPYDTQQFIKQVMRIGNTTEDEVGDNFKVINMRRVVDNNLKKELIELLVKTDKPDVLVIDGVVDLLKDFNEVSDSKELISWLMLLADSYKLVLFCVLHTNKNRDDHNMRGHLGTMGEQKCDTLTECEKDDKSSIVTVECATSRHKPYPDWAFTWDENGNLIDALEQRNTLLQHQIEEQKAERERKAQEVKEARKQAMLSIVNGNGGTMLRSELTSSLMASFDKSNSTVSPLITEWINEEVLFEDGKYVMTSRQTELFK